MRLSGPLSEKIDSPEHWIKAIRAAGYTAAGAPIGPDADDATVSGYVQAAAKADVIISEVGAWSNPIDPDSTRARAAIAHCQRHLDLAERLGARCCVNICGSRNPEKWDGPARDNLSRDTFDLIVRTTREIVDAVNPKQTFYTLETMPWIFPSSPDEYLELIRAIDRPGVAVHLDPVNMINTPARCFNNAQLLRECFEKLGPLIKSCHAKDIILQDSLTVHLDERRPGAGVLDYPVFLAELSKLDPDIPLMLEHLPDSEYPLAARYLRSVAAQHNIPLK